MPTYTYKHAHMFPYQLMKCLNIYWLSFTLSTIWMFSLCSWTPTRSISLLNAWTCVCFSFALLDDMDALALPLDTNKIYFAGEATSSEHPSTVHGNASRGLCVCIHAYILYTYVHTYLHAYIWALSTRPLFMVMQAGDYVYVYMHTYCIRTYIHTYMHTYELRAPVHCSW